MIETLETLFKKWHKLTPITNSEFQKVWSKSLVVANSVRREVLYGARRLDNYNIKHFEDKIKLWKMFSGHCAPIADKILTSLTRVFKNLIDANKLEVFMVECEGHRWNALMIHENIWFLDASLKKGTLFEPLIYIHQFDELEAQYLIEPDFLTLKDVLERDEQLRRFEEEFKQDFEREHPPKGKFDRR